MKQDSEVNMCIITMMVKLPIDLSLAGSITIFGKNLFSPFLGWIKPPKPCSSAPPPHPPLPHPAEIGELDGVNDLD